MPIDSTEIQTSFRELRQEADLLAGALSNLEQRATTYHHLYRDSGGNHVFPLIASHGALWAKGYFQFGAKLGRILSLQYFFDSEKRQQQLENLAEFADAFREINRLVCVDTYTNYHLVKRFGEIPELLEVISPEILTALGRVHWARKNGQLLAESEKRNVFRAHFLHEQNNVVGPSVMDAMAAIDWKLLEMIAIRPVVRFSYFPVQKTFWFRNFTSREERINKGMKAFDIGSHFGWEQVEAKLAAYQTLPHEFFENSISHFDDIKNDVLGAV